MPSDSPSEPVIAVLAAVAVVQVAATVALNAESPSLRRAGAYGAAALASLGLITTLTLAAGLVFLVAAFVIDSASGRPPAGLDQILVELHLAQYLSAAGIVIAVPILAVPSLLNARAALTEFARQKDRVRPREHAQVRADGG